MSMAIRSASRRPMAGRVDPRMYQGDPGLFGALKGAIGGLVTGGPLGAITGGIAGLTGGSRRSTSTAISLPATNLPAVPRPGVGGFVQRAIPGGQSGYVSAAPPKGYRLNKTSYWLKDGTFVPEGSKWVKIRRRNPLNPRAASRAISRLESAKKAVKRLNRVSIRRAS